MQRFSGLLNFSWHIRLAHDTSRPTKAELEHTLELDTMRTYNGPLVSPVSMVSKAGYDWRSGGKYEAIKKVTFPDRYSSLYVRFCDLLRNQG